MSEAKDPPTMPVAPIGGDTVADQSRVFTSASPVSDPQVDQAAPTVLTPVSGSGIGPRLGSLDKAQPRPESSPAAVLAAFAPPTLPALLGRYTLLERLGVGGMAEVFLAEQDGPAGFKKRVVVKRILPHLAQDERFVDMFLREARVAAQVNHTHVVTIYELGQENDVFFIAMEYVDGLSLFHLARRAWHHGRSIPLELVVTAIADAAAGLESAYHTRGADGRPLHLVHRDISPDNLMINKEGITKILDFGIAKGATTESVTKTGELKGKLPFMPPEQVDGGELDHRSDLYSLGVTAYWLLTGQRPFDESGDLRLMQSILAGRPRPIRALNPEVPLAVEAWVHNLMARDRNDRPASGADVARQLSLLVPGARHDIGAFVREVANLERPVAGAPSRTVIPVTPTTGSIHTAMHELPLGLKPAEELTGERPIVSPDGTPASIDVPLSGITTRSELTGAHALDPAPAGAAPRRPWLLGVAAAGVLAVVGVGLVGLGGGGTTENPVSPPPPSSVEPPGDGVPPTDPTGAPSTTGPTANPGGTVGAKPPGSSDDPSRSPDPTPAEPAIDDGPDDEADPHPKRSRGRSSGRSRPAVHEVVLKAPGRILWSVPGGKRISKGGGKASVPAGTDVLLAYDPTWGVKTRVPVRGGGADYGALRHGKLLIRAYPFADVYAGKKHLGTTPLPAKDVVEGTYELRLVHKDREIRRTVEVAGGETTLVKVDMTN